MRLSPLGVQNDLNLITEFVAFTTVDKAIKCKGLKMGGLNHLSERLMHFMIFPLLGVELNHWIELLDFPLSYPKLVN